jgi:hypothetical protein
MPTKIKIEIYYYQVDENMKKIDKFTVKMQNYTNCYFQEQGVSSSSNSANITAYDLEIIFEPLDYFDLLVHHFV